MINHRAKTVDIHTREQVSAEVEVLCRDMHELNRLINLGVLRAWCFEDDLRIEAYNRLTDKLHTK